MTVLYQNGIGVEDLWITVDGDAPVPDGEDVLVPLSYYLENREALLARNNGRVGVILSASDNVQAIADDLERISVTGLEFPAYSDGRSFSNARLLRDQYSYSGEIRAIGDVRIDQIDHMTRCGFDAFEITHEATIKALEAQAANAPGEPVRGTGLDLFYQPVANDGSNGEKRVAGRAWARRGNISSRPPDAS